MASESLKDRVAALEAEVAEIRARMRAMPNSSVPWWKLIQGAFADDPAFEEAMRLGREYRESFRPKPLKQTKR